MTHPMPRPSSSPRRWIACLALAMLAGCGASAVPNRAPLGETFPAVSGETLAGQPLRLPDDLRGRPAIVLIGYLQEAQFDADRWLYGLLQADLDVRILEVPTIPGLFPRAFAGAIDSGMRSGIPAEDWQVVVTLYGDDAAAVRDFTGDEAGRNIRVLLLDADGRVRWMHDRGYSAGKQLELERTLAGLPATSA